MNLFVFGLGYSGGYLGRRLLQGGDEAGGDEVSGREAGGRPVGAGTTMSHAVWGTSRRPSARLAMQRWGAVPVDPADAQALAAATSGAEAILIAAPPDASGCPGLRALRPILRRKAGLAWIGYLSTTGVYGDRGGRWVFETSDPRPITPEGERRTAAERAWAALAGELGLKLSVFRLPGIYGPGRSALDRVRAGEASRIVKPGHVFSRIHVQDLAGALIASLAQPGRNGVYNLCDDEPAPSAEVNAYAAQLLGAEPPAEQVYDPQRLSVMARRFWAESKRVGNARAKAALGWRPLYPSYREGLAAILEAERRLSA